jgi:hypothetical protein
LHLNYYQNHVFFVTVFVSMTIANVLTEFVFGINFKLPLVAFLGFVALSVINYNNKELILFITISSILVVIKLVTAYELNVPLSSLVADMLYVISFSFLLTSLSFKSRFEVYNKNHNFLLFIIFIYVLVLLFLAIFFGSSAYQFSETGFKLPVGSTLDHLVFVHALFFLLISLDRKYLILIILLSFVLLIVFPQRTSALFLIVYALLYFRWGGYTNKFFIIPLVFLVFSFYINTVYLQDSFLARKISIDDLSQGRTYLAVSIITEWLDEFDVASSLFGTVTQVYFERIAGHTILLESKKSVEIDLVDGLMVFGLLAMIAYLAIICFQRGLVRLFLGITLFVGHFFFNYQALVILVIIKKISLEMSKGSSESRK